MKTRIFTSILLVLVTLSTFTGCNRAQKQAPATAITLEEAMDLALTHAGFLAEEVTFTKTEFETEDKIPQYDISFRQNGIEYDYDIDAQSGSILSFDKDE